MRKTTAEILLIVACGIATVLVPLYLQSVSPPAIAGNIGQSALPHCLFDVASHSDLGVSILYSRHSLSGCDQRRDPYSSRYFDPVLLTWNRRLEKD